MPDRMVIVGTGVAGATAALTLRSEGHTGPITLIGDEPHEPYRRPPLSKDLLTGAIGFERARLKPSASWAERDIDLRTGTAVTAIDRDRRTVVLDDGTELGYDRLLLATGSRARSLPGIAGLPGVHTLRTAADAEALRSELGPGRSLLVLGAGLVGLEVAASARSLGCDVTVLELGDRPLARVLPERFALALRDLHEANGVRIRTGVRVEAVEHRGGVLLAHGDGAEWKADVLVVAAGARPDTALAERAGLETGDGIVVDALGATRDPDVFAAGDVAEHPDALTGGRHRGEHWNHAQEHGAAVARSMLGRGAPFRSVPWCWTDQFGVTVQICGRPSGELELDGDLAAFDFAAMAHRDGRPVGAVAAGRPAEFRRMRQRVAEALPGG